MARTAWQIFADKVTPLNRGKSRPDWTYRKENRRNVKKMTRARWRELQGNPALVW